MFDIVAFLKSIIATYSEDIVFIHGSDAEGNLNVNDIQGEVVFFERPYTLSGVITGSGIIEGRLRLNLFFLNGNQYHNEGGQAVNAYQDAVDTQSIKPALESAQTFLAALRNDSRVKELSGFDFMDITDFPEFDNNMSGGMLTASFTVYNAGNVCETPTLPEEE